MAAVAIGTSIWLPAILFGHGLLLALTPVIAQLNGSGRRERIAHQVRQGFWLAGFVSVLIMLVLWNAGYIIRSMENIDPAPGGQSRGLSACVAVGRARGYLFFVLPVIMKVWQNQAGMVMGLIGLLVNIPVNYIFIYGHFGMHKARWRWLWRGYCGGVLGHVPCHGFFKRARSMRDIRNEKAPRNLILRL